jgi:hypothetical protein
LLIFINIIEKNEEQYMDEIPISIVGILAIIFLAVGILIGVSTGSTGTRTNAINVGWFEHNGAVYKVVKANVVVVEEK